MKLRLESETIGRTGGITGSGAKKVIGAPHIDSLEVVIREAVQNSWDAAEGRSIDFEVIGYEFQRFQETSLREALHEGTIGKDPVITLPDGRLDALLLWDKGTSGLSGGMRPDESEDGKRDFVRFVYMIGDTKVQTDAFAKGGTYGFGRSSFLNASRVGTILIHSVCEHNASRQSRFIGMTWTDPDRLGKTRFTGRHWWGELDTKGDGEHILPVIGREAHSLAESLGMNVFSADELGTAILILLPRWSSADGELVEERTRALSQVRSGLLWNCWPRLLDGTIRASIQWFGESVSVPDPQAEPRLKIFARAFAAAGVAEGSPSCIRQELECMKPIKTLGTLTLTKAAFAPQTGTHIDSDEGRDERDPQRPLRHVAMMRGTHLVIQYFQGPMPPDGLQYAGVFLADEGVDAVYAASEPPAHDDWVKERLSGQDRTIVNVTYKRTTQAIQEFLNPSVPAPGADQPMDFGVLADQLGRLFTGVQGDGAGEFKGGAAGGAGDEGVGGNGRKRVNVTMLPAQRLPLGDELELRVPVRVRSKGRVRESVTLSARVVVLVDGGAEKQRPEGAAVPAVLGWRLSTDATLLEGSSVRMEVQGERECILSIRQPRDCSIKLLLEAQ